MKDEWFRNSKWDDDEQKHFFEKLSKSRDFNKAQYMGIKAYSLLDTKKKKSALAAIDLTRLQLKKYPNKSELASCYSRLAECYVLLGETHNASEYFEKCLEQEKVFPNVKTHTTLSYPEWIVKNNFQNQFNRALEVLDIAIDDDFSFPNEFFIYHGLRAIILKDMDEKNMALFYAKKKHSDLYHHSQLGLVEPNHWLIKELKNLK